MKQFDGFPDRMQFTSIPNLFISRLMPEIDDIGELKTTLQIFRMIYGKRGYPRFVTYAELLSDTGLVQGLGKKGKEPAEALSESLDMAVKRGTVVRLEMEKEGNAQDLYFLNTEKDREAAGKIRNGEIVLKGLKTVKGAASVAEAEPLPDIFTLYEENMGMLTPLIAEWLKEAESLYPESWIRDAIKEAVSLNKRNWRYIDRILENWSAEGRGDGTAHRRDSKTDPSKYRKQKYDHLVKH